MQFLLAAIDDDPVLCCAAQAKGAWAFNAGKLPASVVLNQQDVKVRCDGRGGRHHPSACNRSPMSQLDESYVAGDSYDQATT